MKRKLVQVLTMSAFAIFRTSSYAQAGSRCVSSGPPSVWIEKALYPFQAGTERAFDELYHGLWKTQADIDLYDRPRGHKTGQTIRDGRIVEALLGEVLVVHPMRFVAAKDFTASSGSPGGKIGSATVRKGESFWVLNSAGEGEFSIWWHCSVVGWDSTEPADVQDERVRLLGFNEERWVKIKDKSTGLAGWFKDVPTQEHPKLTPARTTAKSAG